MIKSSYLLFCCVVFITLPAEAHTISQHIQELYGEVYFPLFILAALLPFVGPGISTGLGSSKSNKYKIPAQFILAMAASYLLSFFLNVPDFVISINRLSIVIIGLYLLIWKNPRPNITLTLNLVMGTTIGLEYGSFFAHSSEMRWLYLLIPSSGIVVFYLLVLLFSKDQIKNSSLRIISGCILILLGLIVILLT